MVNAIPAFDFGRIIGPLEKRFRKLSDGQQEVYYERLKFNDQEVLKKAVEHLVDEAVHFPTPGEIRRECRTFGNAMGKSGAKNNLVRESCTRCREGYVQFSYQHYRRDESFVTRYEARPCAVCNTEPNGVPHYTQIDGKIYMAARKLSSGMWIPDLKDLEWCQDYTAIYSSEALEEYYLEDRSGAAKAMSPEQVKEGLVQVQNHTMPKPKQGDYFNPNESRI